MPNLNDVVLIYFDEKPSIFARIEAIEPDVKKGWYQISLLLLTIPTQNVTWILRDEYIDGKPFTMGGKPVRLEAVEHSFGKAEPQVTRPSAERKGPVETKNVIPFKKPKKE